MKPLTDGTIVIRPYRKSDTRHLYAAVRESIAEIHPWMQWCHPNYSREESETWVTFAMRELKLGKDYGLVIADAATGRFLGGTGLNQFNHAHDFANLGYWVRTSATGGGIATRATRLVAAWGFKELDLTRIEIVVDVRNVASNRVAVKSGATREGVLRNRLVEHGKAQDAIMYSLIPTDVQDVRLR